MKYISALVILAALFAVVACNNGSKASQVQKSEQAIVGQYQSALNAAEPYPLAQMKDSTERRNLIEKLLRFNDPEKIGYVYELTQTGQVFAFYTIKGKVSNTDSQLTTPDTVATQYSGDPILHSPGDDGSYGPNEPGIFFFTTEGVMLTWNGLYQYSDAPLKLTAQPIAFYDPSSKPSNTGQTANIPTPSIIPEAPAQ